MFEPLLTHVCFLIPIIAIILASEFDGYPLTRSCESRNGEPIFSQSCLTEAIDLTRSHHIYREVSVLPVEATCGLNGTSYYCQLEFSNSVCGLICDANEPIYDHRPALAADGTLETWWQSIPWHSFPSSLDVTLHISYGKAYQLTDDLIVTFRSARARRMLIERSPDYGVTWYPWQYYSQDCSLGFGIHASSRLDYATHVICTQLYSNILPYTQGQVIFPVVSRYQFYLGEDLSNPTSLYQSYEQSNWFSFLHFTDIRLRLLEPATDGEEFNGGDNLLKYYYAISDVSLVAECWCNLHARRCVQREGRNVCDCAHNTEGPDCGSCLPLYNNTPWRRGLYLADDTGNTANECQRCECNAHASSCQYDPMLGYGVCLDCQHNTQGHLCEECQSGFYHNISVALNDTNTCIDCACEPFGTVSGSISCGTNGLCYCESHVTGDKCDRCEENYFGLIAHGDCKECLCDPNGVVMDSLCDPLDGSCLCKPSVNGPLCSRCIDGFYSFPTDPALGCLPCDCDRGGAYNQSCGSEGQCFCRPNIIGRKCDTVSLHHFLPRLLTVVAEQETDCARHYQIETGESWTDSGYRLVCQPSERVVYTLPSYNRFNYHSVSLSVAVEYEVETPPVSLALIASPSEFCLQPQPNPEQHELTSELSWSTLLFNVTLDASCGYNLTLVPSSGPIILKSFSVVTLPQADWLPADPQLLIGSSLANETSGAAVFSASAVLYGAAQACRCDPIGSLNETCTSFGGQCLCKAGVKGRTCDRCLAGFKLFSAHGCEECRCSLEGSHHPMCEPDSGQCACRDNFARRDETDSYGDTRSARCEFCLIGYFNSEPTICSSCDCHPVGLLSEQCDHQSGQCFCKPGVGFGKCTVCRDGYYGLSSAGCSSCDCDDRGSISEVCDRSTGQCPCKVGAEGRRCDRCKPDWFGLTSTSETGCTPCFCSAHHSPEASCQAAHEVTITLQYHADTSRLNTTDVYNASSLLPLYGHRFTFYVTPSINQPTPAFLGSLQGSTTIRFYHDANLTAGETVYSGFTLVESSNWAPRNTLNFMAVLQTSRLALSPDLTYTSLSLPILDSLGGLNQSATSLENCTCHPNTFTQGLSCDTCLSGYKRSQPELGALSKCEPCECNNRSSMCDPVTGNCQNCVLGTRGDNCETCDLRVTGLHCSTCEFGFWGLQLYNRCVECDCDLAGSLNSTCDQLLGQCYCRNNVGGLKCNACQRNHQQLSASGCTACGECYNLVADKTSHMEDVLSRFKETDLTLNSFNPPSPNYNNELVAIYNTSLTFNTALDDLALRDDLQSLRLGELSSWLQEFNVALLNRLVLYNHETYWSIRTRVVRLSVNIGILQEVMEMYFRLYHEISTNNPGFLHVNQSNSELAQLGSSLELLAMEVEELEYKSLNLTEYLQTSNTSYTQLLNSSSNATGRIHTLLLQVTDLTFDLSIIQTRLKQVDEMLLKVRSRAVENSHRLDMISNQLVNFPNRIPFNQTWISELVERAQLLSHETLRDLNNQSVLIPTEDFTSLERAALALRSSLDELTTSVRGSAVNIERNIATQERIIEAGGRLEAALDEGQQGIVAFESEVNSSLADISEYATSLEDIVQLAEQRSDWLNRTGSWLDDITTWNSLLNNQTVRLQQESSALFTDLSMLVNNTRFEDASLALRLSVLLYTQANYTLATMCRNNEWLIDRLYDRMLGLKNDTSPTDAHLSDLQHTVNDTRNALVDVEALDVEQVILLAEALLEDTSISSATIDTLTNQLAMSVEQQGADILLLESRLNAVSAQLSTLSAKLPS